MKKYVSTYAEFVNESAHTKWERVEITDVREYDGKSGTDDYLYHITSEPVAEIILATGELKSGQSLIGRGSYYSHSRDRVFLTERNGVAYWMNTVKMNLADMYEHPPEVVVLRIPQTAVPELETDEEGSNDARAMSYYKEGGFKA